MAAQALSRELALRIGLAAKVLPDIEARDLLLALVDQLGTPLTDKKLSALTIVKLKDTLSECGGNSINNDALKLALSYLWGDGVKDPSIPDLDSYQEGDMPESIRVALATQGDHQLNGHFGSCPYFYIYQVDIAEIRLVDVRSTAGSNEAEDKNAFRADLINDCNVMYVQSIGGPAAAKVVRANIHPIKVPNGGDAEEVLTKLQQTLAGTPPPWLAKAMGVSAEERVRFQQEAEA